MMDSTARSFDLFGHLLLGGGNWVEIVSEEYGGGSNGGTSDSAPAMGRLVWGWNDFVLGCSFSNPSNGNLLGNAAGNGSAYNYAGNPFTFNKTTNYSGLNAFTGGEFLTGVFAAPSGEGGFSVNVGVYMDKNNDKNSGQGAGFDGENNRTASGYSFGATFGNGDNLDVAAQITMLSGKSENSQSAATTDDNLENSGFNLSAYGEFHLDDVNRIQGGIMFGSETSTDQLGGAETAPEGDDEYSNMGIMVGLGRTLAESDDQIVTAEFFLQFMSTTTTGTGGADGVAGAAIPEDKTSMILIPGTRVATRHQVSEHFGINAGATASWSTNSTEDTAGTPTQTDETSFANASFSWDCGITATYGPLTIDTFLITGNLGKILSLGNNNALVGGVSATATF